MCTESERRTKCIVTHLSLFKAMEFTHVDTLNQLQDYSTKKDLSSD